MYQGSARLWGRSVHTDFDTSILTFLKTSIVLCQTRCQGYQQILSFAAGSQASAHVRPRYPSQMASRFPADFSSLLANSACNPFYLTLLQPFVTSFRVLPSVQIRRLKHRRLFWYRHVRKMSLLTVLSFCAWNIDADCVHWTRISNTIPCLVKTRQGHGGVVVTRNGVRVQHGVAAVCDVHSL